MKPRTLLLLSIACSLAVLVQDSFSQWVQTNGPYCGHFNHLVVLKDSMLFATTSGGLFRSFDNGATWSRVVVEEVQTPEIYNALVSIGNTIFIGSLYSGLFRSTDYGTSWMSIALPTSAEAAVFNLAVQDSTLYVSWWDQALHRSTDLGETWTVLTPINEWAQDHYPSYPMPVAFNGHTIIAGSNGLTDGGFFRSTDAGATWSLADSSKLGQIAANALLVRDGTFFLGSNHGTFISRDGGTSWVVMDTSFKDRNVTALATLDTLLFAGTSEGVFIWDGQNQSWKGASPGLTNTRVNALVTKGRSVYACTDDGLYVSTDCGSHWTTSPSDFQLVSGISFSVCFTETGGAMLFDGGGDGMLYRSRDNGDHWTRAYSGLPQNIMLTTPGVTSFRNELFWPVTFSVFSMGSDTSSVHTIKGLYRSTDDGETWTPYDDGIDEVAYYRDGTVNVGVNTIIAEGSNLFAGTQYGLYKLECTSDKWIKVSDTNLSNVNIDRLAGNGKHILAWTNNGVFHSADSGLQWEKVHPEWMPGHFRAYASDSTFFVTASWITEYKHWNVLYRSTDYGVSWDNILDQAQAMAKSGNDLFVAEYSGVFLSTDNGTSWKDFHSSELNNYGELAISGGYLFESMSTGTVGGVWRRPLTDFLTGVSERSTVPLVFKIEQNYPNPFNPSTTIRYSLPHRSHVTMTVFNTLGQQVSQLINGEIESGNHEVQFNATNLASGVYFYRIQAGTYTETKSFLLIR